MDTLKPESSVPQKISLPTPVIEPTPIEEKPAELLLNVDGDDKPTEVNNPCNRILADLTDLRFDEIVDSDEKQMEGKDHKSAIFLFFLRLEFLSSFDGSTT